MTRACTKIDDGPGGIEASGLEDEMDAGKGRSVDASSSRQRARFWARTRLANRP